MGTIVGRGIRVEVGKTEGAPVTVSEVSNEKPAVATAAGHSLVAKSLGYFKDVLGMPQIEGQACRVAAPASGTFQLEGLDTSTFSDYTGGKFVPVTAWATVAEITSYSIPDGTADELDDTKLLDDIKQTINGLLNSQSPTFNTNAQETPSEGMLICEAAAENQGYLVFRITFKSGVVRFFRAQPSLPGENVQKGALGTGSMNATVKGRILRGAA